MTRVVDYAWTKPASLAAYAGVMRYISHDASKDLSPAERDWVRGQGKTIGLVFEATANRAAQGFAAGQADAAYANGRADALGYPRSCTLWYAVDFDASAAQVQPYFDGIASVGGRPHAPYGGFKVIDAVRYPALGWQTVAWSGGRVSSRAGLLQDRFSGSYDENRVLIDAYGAWGATGPTPTPTPTQEEPVGAYPLPILSPGEEYTFRPPPADHTGGIPFGAVFVSFAADFGDPAISPAAPVPLRTAHWDVKGGFWVVDHGGGSYDKSGKFVEDNKDVPPLYVPTNGDVVAVRWPGAWSKGSIVHCGHAGRIVPLVEYVAG